MEPVSRWAENFRWGGVSVLAYKENGTHFKSITRQVVFEGDPELPCQWRYFEVEEGGYSTLERHEHLHVVMIIRGEGRCLVGDRVHDVRCFDVVRVPALTWHQFQPVSGEILGFLCLVNVERDRPQLPDADALAALRAVPAVAAFIKT
ncbi:MAG: cupin domain-containing protein [Deltaproteobacteria bacterium]|nr:cupin domain-containing protein [Deltaproteobacteria bacterium]